MHLIFNVVVELVELITIQVSIEELTSDINKLVNTLSSIEVRYFFSYGTSTHVHVGTCKKWQSS